jgi:phosphinothricin acetyltransferase
LNSFAPHTYRKNLSGILDTPRLVLRNIEKQSPSALRGVANMRGRAPPASMIVRDAREPDMAAVQRIYEHNVLHGRASFEETPPTLPEMLERRRSVLGLGLPYLVAEVEGEIAGYSYATSYRPRPAYRFTVEDSVYVADSYHGRGIGAALLGALIERCSAGSWRQMLAIIGHSGNASSIAVHRRLGFEHVGTLKSVGFKLGTWTDTVLMQRALGAGDTAPPRG